MATRKRYIYTHYVNNKVVSKEEFFKELEPFCMRCDTNYDNPLMNISYLDTKKLKSKYDYFKTHPRSTTIYIDSHKSFHISREVKTK